MSLTHEQADRYLTKIFSGLSYSYVEDKLVVFKFPSHSIKQRAALVYERAFQKAVAQGILPAKELEEVISARNLITEVEVLKLKKLHSQLDAQEILLGKTTIVKANQDRIKGVILRLKHEIRDIEIKKSSKMLMCAENKAEEEKTFFVCSMCAYNEDGNTLIWPTYEAALQERNLEYRDNVLLAFLKFYSGFDVSIIRELARSSLWRIRYISSIKTSDPMFGVPASDYTTDQLNLAYWSNYYQNIYDMMPEDRPSDMVIEDDDSLDAYMKVFYEERNKEDAGRRHKSKRSGKLSAFDAEEVIITRSHELYEDINYDTPKESQKIKDRVDLKKRTKRG